MNLSEATQKRQRSAARMADANRRAKEEIARLRAGAVMLDGASRRSRRRDASQQSEQEHSDRLSSHAANRMASPPARHQSSAAARGSWDDSVLYGEPTPPRVRQRSSADRSGHQGISFGALLASPLSAGSDSSDGDFGDVTLNFSRSRLRDSVSSTSAGGDREGRAELRAKILTRREREVDAREAALKLAEREVMRGQHQLQRRLGDASTVADEAERRVEVATGRLQASTARAAYFREQHEGEFTLQELLQRADAVQEAERGVKRRSADVKSQRATLERKREELQQRGAALEARETEARTVLQREEASRNWEQKMQQATAAADSAREQQSALAEKERIVTQALGETAELTDELETREREVALRELEMQDLEGLRGAALKMSAEAEARLQQAAGQEHEVTEVLERQAKLDERGRAQMQREKQLEERERQLEAAEASVVTTHENAQTSLQAAESLAGQIDERDQALREREKTKGKESRAVVAREQKCRGIEATVKGRETKAKEELRRLRLVREGYEEDAKKLIADQKHVQRRADSLRHRESALSQRLSATASKDEVTDTRLHELSEVEAKLQAMTLELEQRQRTLDSREAELREHIDAAVVAAMRTNEESLKVRSGSLTSREDELAHRSGELEAKLEAMEFRERRAGATDGDEAQREEELQAVQITAAASVKRAELAEQRENDAAAEMRAFQAQIQRLTAQRDVVAARGDCAAAVMQAKGATVTVREAAVEETRLQVSADRQALAARQEELSGREAEIAELTEGLALAAGDVDSREASVAIMERDVAQRDGAIAAKEREIELAVQELQLREDRLVAEERNNFADRMAGLGGAASSPRQVSRTSAAGSPAPSHVSPHLICRDASLFNGYERSSPSRDLEASPAPSHSAGDRLEARRIAAATAVASSPRKSALASLRGKLVAAAFTFGHSDLPAFFRRRDKDHSGGLALGEFISTVRKEAKVPVSVLSDEDLRSIWSAIDTDNSGVVDLNEFVQWLSGAESATGTAVMDHHAAAAELTLAQRVGDLEASLRQRESEVAPLSMPPPLPGPPQ